MSIINFPQNPTLYELYPFGGKTWQWNGSYWQVYSSGVTITDVTYSANTGQLNITKSDATQLSAGTWVYVTGGSYDVSTRDITLSANTGGTFTISNLDYNGVTDLAYDIPTRILSISRPSGPDSVDLSSLIGNLVYSGSYNSSTGVITFYPVSGDPFTVSGFVTGITNYYTTGFTYTPETGLLSFNRSDLQNAYSGFTSYYVSGDTNYVVKYNSTGTTESLIYDNGTNVGFNTTSPSYLLDVNGNTRLQSNVGIGPSGSSSSYGVWNTLPFSGSATFYGITNDSLISSGVTNSFSYYSLLGLNDFSATNANITHFYADQKTFTTNRNIGTNTAFRAGSNLTGTTAVYGFLGEVTSGSGKWNLYVPGTANNFLKGKLLVGNSGQTVSNATFENPISSTLGPTSIFQAGSVQGSVSSVFGIRNQSIMSASATVTTYTHFSAAQGISGASSSITTQIGFSVGSDMTNGSTNIAFNGNLNSGSGRYNLYMIGTADNYINGRIGQGSTSISNINLRLALPLQGGLSAYGIYQGGFVASGVSTAYGIQNFFNTFANNTLKNYIHFNATNGTDSPVTGLTNNYGYFAHQTLAFTGASNNYGFYSNLASGTSATQNWNFYANGTAHNYFRGRLGMNTVLVGAYSLRIENDIIPDSGTIYYGISQNGTITSDIAAVYGINNTHNIAANRTATTYSNFYVQQGTFGANSKISEVNGYHVRSNLTSGDTIYGFRGEVVSASSRWNIYMNGSAPNYIGGDLRIGTVTNSGYKLDVNGTGRTSNLIVTNRVGIGTTSPLYTLQTTGDFALGTGGSGSGTRGALMWNNAANTFSFNNSSGDKGVYMRTNYGSINGQQAGAVISNVLGGGLIITGDYSLPEVSQNHLVITSVGVVGIGTTTPNPFTANTSDGVFHVKSGNSGVPASLGPGGGTVIIESDTTNYLQMYAPDANVNGVVFGSATDPFGAFLRWGYNQGKLEIGTANSSDYIEFSVANDVKKAYLSTNGFGVNTQPVSSAALEISATTQGFLPPRMTNTQIMSISSPATGLMAYSTTDNLIVYYNGSNWMKITGVTTL